MHITKSLVKTVLFVYLASILAACAPSVTKNAIKEPLRPKILIGASTKTDVEALLGRPTEVLSREGEVWVYRGLKPENVEDLMPFYCGDKPLVFFFSLDGSVSSISRRVPEAPSLQAE